MSLNTSVHEVIPTYKACAYCQHRRKWKDGEQSVYSTVALTVICRHHCPFVLEVLLEKNHAYQN